MYDRRDQCDSTVLGLILARRQGIFRTFPLQGVLTMRELACVRAGWNRRERTEGYLGRERRQADRRSA